MTRDEAIKELQLIAKITMWNDRREAVEMAIKALEDIERWRTWSHTYDNLISRQDAIRWVKTECNPYGKPTLDFESGKKVIEHLGQMPSAEPKTGWIPVSERLPDIGDTFLVTVMVGTKVETDVADSFGSYIDGFWNTFNDWIEDEECHVIAWMPLPEPYKGGDSDV